MNEPGGLPWVDVAGWVKDVDSVAKQTVLGVLILAPALLTIGLVELIILITT